MVTGDKKTVAYFDTFVPEYYEERYEHAVRVINAHCKPGAHLIDLGCGNGNILRFVRDRTPVEQLVGLDASKSYLAQAQKQAGCETVMGSILDSSCVAALKGQFDFALMGALLHHMVGGTRRQSRRLAKLAFSNGLKTLKDGGLLFVLEPAYSPPLMADIIFYVKSLVAKVSSKRVELFRAWANIGPPVVSYYSVGQLAEMIAEDPEAEIVGRAIKGSRRVGLVMRRTEITFVVRKVAERT